MATKLTITKNTAERCTDHRLGLNTKNLNKTKATIIPVMYANIIAKEKSSQILYTILEQMLTVAAVPPASKKNRNCLDKNRLDTTLHPLR
jgi:hypothetical protein